MSGSFREFLTPCSIGLWSRSVKVATSAQLSMRFGPVADLLQVQSAVVKDRFVAFDGRGGRGTRDIAADAYPPRAKWLLRGLFELAILPDGFRRYVNFIIPDDRSAFSMSMIEKIDIAKRRPKSVVQQGLAIVNAAHPVPKEDANFVVCRRHGFFYKLIRHITSTDRF